MPERVFSLHIDTARTLARRPESGAADRQRPARDRATGPRSSRTRTASCCRRAAEGLDLVPLAPRTEMDLSAAWRLSRVLKRLRPDVIHAHDPHGVAMAALALPMSRIEPVAARSSPPDGSTFT